MLPLIKTPSGKNVVLAAIVRILAEEAVSQIALATSGGEPDPQEWHYKVYKNSANPVDITKLGSPVVNVVAPSWTLAGGSSSLVNTTGTSNIEVQVLAASKNKITTTTHTTADEAAMEIVDRIGNIVFRILTSVLYRNLELLGQVGAITVTTTKDVDVEGPIGSDYAVKASILTIEVPHTDDIIVSDEALLQKINAIISAPNGVQIEMET